MNTATHEEEEEGPPSFLLSSDAVCLLLPVSKGYAQSGKNTHERRREQFFSYIIYLDGNGGV